MDNKALVRRAKASAQYVVECVEVMSPVSSRYQDATDLTEKLFKGPKLGSIKGVDLQHWEALHSR